MDEDLKRKALEMAAAEGIELSDEMLDAIAGGYIYHDEGDPAAHRKEAFYVLDGNGTVDATDASLLAQMVFGA